MNSSSVCCTIEATCFAFAAKTWLLFPFGVINGDGILIQERGLARVAFFDCHDVNAHQPGFVRHHVNKASMRNLHERLIVPFADLNLLLPKRVLSDDERA